MSEAFTDGACTPMTELVGRQLCQLVAFRLGFLPADAADDQESRNKESTQHSSHNASYEAHVGTFL